MSTLQPGPDKRLRNVYASIAESEKINCPSRSRFWTLKCRPAIVVDLGRSSMRNRNAQGRRKQLNWYVRVDDGVVNFGCKGDSQCIATRTSKLLDLGLGGGSLMARGVYLNVPQCISPNKSSMSIKLPPPLDIKMPPPVQPRGWLRSSHGVIQGAQLGALRCTRAPGTPAAAPVLTCHNSIGTSGSSIAARPGRFFNVLLRYRLGEQFF